MEKFFCQPSKSIFIILWSWVIIFIALGIVIEMEILKFNVWSVLCWIVGLALAITILVRYRLTIESEKITIRLLNRTVNFSKQNLKPIRIVSSNIQFISSDFDIQPITIQVSKKQLVKIKQLLEKYQYSIR